MVDDVPMRQIDDLFSGGRGVVKSRVDREPGPAG